VWGKWRLLTCGHTPTRRESKASPVPSEAGARAEEETRKRLALRSVIDNQDRGSFSFASHECAAIGVKLTVRRGMLRARPESAPARRRHPGRVEQGLQQPWATHGRMGGRMQRHSPGTLDRARWLAIVFGLLSLPPASGATPATPGAPRLDIEIHLPPDIVYEQSLKADSAVVFSHGTHVALAENRCTGCHPKPFRMLTPTHHTTHGEMNAGASCGICHDGKRAFGLRDRESCATCHSGRRARQMAAGDSLRGQSKGSTASASGLPKPVAYARGDGSPGQVIFRHETHAGAKRPCSACHLKLFPMKASPPRSEGGMHEPSACGACHDGSKSFGVENPDACARCHVERRGAP